MKPLQGINDFVIRFATVNGSGSASANNLFAKAVFRMGVYPDSTEPVDTSTRWCVEHLLSHGKGAANSHTAVAVRNTA